MPRKKKSTPSIKTALDRQKEMAISAERFLPANLPEARFRQLLRAAWALGETAGKVEIDLLLEYIEQAVDARLNHDPKMPVGPNLSLMLSRPFNRAAWEQALSWTSAALTAEWGHREGFVGAPDFTITSFDFESQQRWGAPKVPGALAISAAPNNRWVAELARAMDAVFDPQSSWTSCEFCNRNEQFRDLSVIGEAITAADRLIGYTSSEAPAPVWRLSGVVCAIGLSKHYSEGSSEIREHCYHVVHGATNQAQQRCARDQIVKPCGDWCSPLTAAMDSTDWSIAFTAELERRAGALVAEGRFKQEDVVFLFAAAAERMIKEAMDFESVHIAHSVSHMTMDDHAPNPVRH